MPIYEYACQACGKQFEITAKMSDPPLETCELCQQGPVKRLISKTAFALKGGGWYTTDYKKPAPASNSDKPAESSEPTTSIETKPAETKTTDKKTETKAPESKPEAAPASSSTKTTK